MTGRLQTNAADAVLNHVQHTVCQPNRAKADVQEGRSMMKQAVMENNLLQPSAAVLQEMAYVPRESRHELPHTKTVKQPLYRVTRQLIPPEPQSLENYVVPGS